MRESSIIQATSRMNTQKTIKAQLKRLGIKKGDTVLVHSSLSRIGWVCGGPMSVIEALIGVVGSQGTIVMPAHSSDLSDPAMWENPPVPAAWVERIRRDMPVFHPKKTPTRGMGAIAELFRSYPQTKRSEHPQCSFAARGKQASYIVKDHALTPSLGMDTPLGKLYELNAKVLLLGVGYQVATCFHLSETLLPKMPKVEQGAPLREGRTRIWKTYQDVDYDTSDFGAIGADFEAAKNTTQGTIGKAVSRVFSFKDAVDYGTRWMEGRRFKK